MTLRYVSEADLRQLIRQRDRDPIEWVRSGVDATRRSARMLVSTEDMKPTSMGLLASRAQKPAGSNPASSPYKPFTIALTGQLPSGKNQVQLLFRNGKVQKYPNKTFTNWRARASYEIHGQFMCAPNIKAPVSLTCDYWPGDARTRDVSGQLDALFHLLVHTKVLKDDGLIWSVFWRRHDLNRKFPKVLMALEAWHNGASVTGEEL